MNCRTISGIFALLALSALFAASPSEAGKILITGEEEGMLAVRNLHKPGAIVIKDIGFPPGGVDKGSIGDETVIPLRRASQTLGLRQAEPDHLLIGIASKKANTPIEITFTFIGKGKERWAYSEKIGIFWNSTKLAELNSNTGETLSPTDFALSVPGEMVREKNLLWITPLEGYREALFDGALISSATDISLLKKDETEALAKKEISYWNETRNLSEKGKILLLNWYGRMEGYWEYDILKELQPDLTILPKDHWAKERWLSPEQWGEYAIVILSHRQGLTTEDNNAINTYLSNGGILITNPGTVVWMIQPKDGPKRNDLDWIGEWKTRTSQTEPIRVPVGKGTFIGIPEVYFNFAPEHITSLRNLIVEELEKKNR
ncbi:MAG: hypothetical protein WDA18_05625 [Candidatus Ratteibacteria bacterium]|jgi:hypothetical protein